MRGANTSVMYGTPAVRRPGMQSPWSARNASSAPNVGATAAPIVGATRSELASTIERLRPHRSDSGPQIQAPIASARMTIETVSPAREGLTWNARPSCGRIAWVEYVTANMPAAPSRKPAMPLESSRVLLRTDEQASVDRGALEEAEPVQPELRVGHHLRVGRGCADDRLDLVGGDAAVADEPLERPRHALHEHLVDDRAQVAVAQPDVTGHAVVVSPVERAAHRGDAPSRFVMNRD